MEPIRCSLSLPVPPGRAFELFTRELGRWWPLSYTWSLDRFAGAEITPERWFERDRDGLAIGWGEVRAWEPPGRLVVAFTVSPRREIEPPERASEVEFRFEAEGGGTRLSLEHRDLERHGEGAGDLRAGMASAQGWPVILASFARWVG